MSHQMKPIQTLAEYCGDGNPVVAQEFTPAKGWVRSGWRKRASFSYLRTLRAEGITNIAVEVAPNRVADFGVTELLAKHSPISLI